MRCLVTFEVFESVTDREAVLNIRRQVGEAMQRIIGTGKVTESGVIVGIRGGFLVVDIDDPAAFLDLTGELVDFMRFNIQPFMSMEELGKYFEKYG